MANDLSAKTCTPCQGGIPPLAAVEARRLLVQAPGWELVQDNTRIEKTFKLGNFGEALDFVQRIGQLAESEGHHPVITFGWGFCTVVLQTKKIKGLHENDFIMAAKVNALCDV